MCWVESIGVSAVELLIGSSCACRGLGSCSHCNLVLISGSFWCSLLAVVPIISLSCAWERLDNSQGDVAPLLCLCWAGWAGWEPR